MHCLRHSLSAPCHMTEGERREHTMRCAIFGQDEPLRQRLRRIIREHGWHLVDAPVPEVLNEDAGIDVAFLLVENSPNMDHVRSVRRALQSALILVLGEASLQVRAEALATGATDFIPSDASGRYIVARVVALARLRKSVALPRIWAGEIEIDLQHRRCAIGNRELTLSQKEFALLALLAGSYGRTLPRSELIEGLWQPGSQIEDNALDVQVSRLRRKLRSRCGAQIITTRGIGYRLAPDDRKSTGAS